MMRIPCTLAIAAGLTVIGSSPIAFAADNDQPPGTGTIERNGAARPMDHQGVIRPSDRDTRDRNQAEVPGTRDNPAIDRDKRFDRHHDRPGGAINPDRDSDPHEKMH
ncbi:hypothetical protein [Reyranella sp.]|jgi:hypothetical protein|uniref:hypothetical protein n=1 Tax=Reyranella sp. TaxID=1929291 RepID=UPI002F934F36